MDPNQPAQNQNQMPSPPNSGPIMPQQPTAAPTTPPQYQPVAAPTSPPPQQPAPQGAKEVSDGKKPNPNSTQNTLLIAEIRDGVAIMHDGSYRAVLLAHSINFDLMSQQEREGVELGFQGFLNSLYYPTQIMMRSRRIDLRGYVGKLEERRQKQDNILLGLLMDDYIAYIQYLSQTANIMDKQFYVVIPYYPSTTEALVNKASKFSKLFTKKSGDVITISEEDFAKAKIELKNRVQNTLEAMNQMGVQAVPLSTQEMIELYYDIYNPETAPAQPLADYHDLEGDFVTRGNEPMGGQA